MTASRVFRGHFDRAQSQQKGRRRILWIAIEPDQADALDAQLGPNPHRSQSIPITFVVGEASEVLFTVGTQLAEQDPPQPSLEAPTVLDEIHALLRAFVADAGACRKSTASIEERLGEIAGLMRATRGFG